MNETQLADLKKYSPYENPKAISLYMLPDGSWVGEANRFGKVVEVREAKPEDALGKILTHG